MNNEYTSTSAYLTTRSTDKSPLSENKTKNTLPVYRQNKPHPLIQQLLTKGYTGRGAAAQSSPATKNSAATKQK